MAVAMAVAMGVDMALDMALNTTSFLGRTRVLT
jgi:hypothetical protein